AHPPRRARGVLIEATTRGHLAGSLLGAHPGRLGAHQEADMFSSARCSSSGSGPPRVSSTLLINRMLVTSTLVSCVSANAGLAWYQLMLSKYAWRSCDLNCRPWRA